MSFVLPDERDLDVAGAMVGSDLVSVDPGGVGGRPVDGLTGVVVIIDAFSRGFRNMISISVSRYYELSIEWQMMACNSLSEPKSQRYSNSSSHGHYWHIQHNHSECQSLKVRCCEHGFANVNVDILHLKPSLEQNTKSHDFL